MREVARLWTAVCNGREVAEQQTAGPQEAGSSVCCRWRAVSLKRMPRSLERHGSKSGRHRGNAPPKGGSLNRRVNSQDRLRRRQSDKRTPLQGDWLKLSPNKMEVMNLEDMAGILSTLITEGKAPGGPAPLPEAPIGVKQQPAATGSRDRPNLQTRQTHTHNKTKQKKGHPGFFRLDPELYIEGSSRSGKSNAMDVAEPSFHTKGKVGNQKRVVGVLLGSWQKKILDVSNSFAVPFDEDDKDDSVWFLDHDYLENMYGMFKKVNAVGPHQAWSMVQPKLIQVSKDGTPTSKTFEHVTSEIGAEEAEEVGVEHLLRDIKDTTVGTLSQRITNQVHGLKGLNSKLLDIRSYLEKVAMGKLPINHQIIYQLQDVFNLLPDVNLQEFVKAFYLKTNDQMVVVYLASLIRSVVALHNLINNKIANRDAEKKEGQEKEESKKERKDEKEKDKEKSDGKKEEKKEKK
ncbi:26S proteasome non-ATPase regulatory subunit 7 [Chelonia mydas]|uniref:26S proteasome non-ATPase regulatory subunit 7 n=1 Tax=Chelonia mydas TaxID=8469 RepID=M7B604_CHEMY|nr:26S proteasome non-ATPase regulatory subunit 7 [Chelonia mydas]